MRKVVYCYGRGTPFCRVAVDHADLSVKAGRITGIIGHTGSGKSTLLQMMNGLLRPEEGTVELFGKNIWDKPKQMRRVAFTAGLVFQYPEYQLFEETVRKDVAYGPKNMGLPEEEIARRVTSALRFVGLDESVADKSPFELSGGQKRRVAIAGIIAMEPEVLILDEPAAGLDPRGREEIFGNVVNYQKETGRTVVIVSHNMEDMAAYAQDLIVLKEGKVILSGPCREVFREKDLLRSAGLNVPQIMVFTEKLRELGVPVPEDVLTVNEAVFALDLLLKGGGDGA